ncbi:MAG TPA: rhomboid family intramembrane serine protease [Candidatus Limnocylindrales bacterium]|jgi:membrane associated rhomboid family serine protease
MDDPRRRPEDPATADGSLDPATAQATPPLPPDVPADGPLTREAARALLDRAGELLQAGDYRDAGVLYRRVVGFDDPTVTAAALLGLAEARYRTDDEESAIATWEAILELPETPSTYHAWRNVAAARVRDGDLQGAVKAYREADRRAPAQDKAEIASRLGWLAKETGNTGASRRYFARARGSGPALPLSWIVIGLTVVTSLAAESVGGEFLFEMLALDKTAVAAGEYYRLWSVTLVHGGPLHLFFNMYALYLCGPIVEQIYGSRLFLAFYLLCAAAGSVASFVFGGGDVSVGASGAIFGLFGVLLAASRTHNPVLDRRGRSLVSQIGMLILINLAFGFALGGLIDNAAHVGGLLAGLWLGVLIVPGGVPTLRSMWQRPTDSAIQPVRSPMLLPALGVVALVVVLAVGIVVGTAQRHGGTASQAPVVTTAIGPADR